MRADNNEIVTDLDFLAVAGQKSRVQSCPLCDGPAPWEDLCGECQTLRKVLIDPFFIYRRR